MRLSIIAPCYNVLQFIDDCIESFGDYLYSGEVELIWINDGPTDCSDCYIKTKYGSLPGLKIVDTANKGLSAARNLGLSYACGDYVAFLDSDDFLQKNIILKILLVLEHNFPDLLIVNFEKYWNDGGVQVLPSIQGLPFNKLIACKDHSPLVSVLDHGELYVWRFIIKRAILIDNNIKFPEGKHYEDISTTPVILKACNNFYYLPIPFIFYRQREGSITKIKNVKNILDLAYSTKYDDKVCSRFTFQERESVSCFSLRTFLWATQDMVKANSGNLLVDNIWNALDQTLYIQEDKALFKLKKLYPREFLKVKILRSSKVLYKLIIALYTKNKFSRKIMMTLQSILFR